ncbi:MAG TPA: C45 family peptidase, partial [Symbiobacteriaceae bacterium]|nr:C45 family peptidase [Symbiobacteriaceae bacterium]
PAAWRDYLLQTWPPSDAWLKVPYPDQATVRAAIAAHMPELLPEYDALTGVLSDLPASHFLLGMYNLPPFWSGCSQTVSHSRGHATLLRNYDLDINGFAGVFLHEPTPDGGWMIGAAEAGWGFLDGLNHHGLAVSITFGGRFVVGDGFVVPIVVRYLLQTCRTTAEAVAVLKRLPARVPQNYLVLDRTGASAVVYTAPDRPAVAEEGAFCCTNHQQQVSEPGHAAFTRTVERYDHLVARNGELTAADFFQPPLYNRRYQEWFGTLYTAEYDPHALTARYCWPGAPELHVAADSPEVTVSVTLNEEEPGA